MKKPVLAIAAVIALGAGSVFAQANVVGNGMPDPPAEVAPHDVYGNSGWTPEQAYGYGVPNRSYRGVYALPDGRLVVPQAYANNNYVYRPYASRGRIGDIDGDGVRDRRDTDRDGDGVRNSRDRYPDDYRYR